MFFLVYLAVYSAGIYYMNLLIRKGPVVQAPSGFDERRVAQRPISAATETGAGPDLAEQR
jgi:cytochrome d ubiquinol oxidase subunit I